jgi:hypothetical protein
MDIKGTKALNLGAFFSMYAFTQQNKRSGKDEKAYILAWSRLYFYFSSISIKHAKIRENLAGMIYL